MANEIDPAHYKLPSVDSRAYLSALGFSQADMSLECIDAMELDHHQWILNSFCLGNAVKYLWRAGQKGDALIDYAKALWYLKRYDSSKLLHYKRKAVEQTIALVSVKVECTRGRLR